MSIFGRKRPKHPLEPPREPIRLGGGGAVAGYTELADESRPATEELPPGVRLPPARLTEARWILKEGRAFAPHCDARILHQPGDCWACDLYPDWQELRKLWGIAFTGHYPDARKGELECPADHNRPPGSSSDHAAWGPNRAQGERRV